MKDHPKKLNGDKLILAPYPSVKEYNPIKKPVANE
jgi:hypothetical protein|tara:strand:+ start:299 stop:403 length:105 start_codon:yes stop_codon:yes gene_type:complete